MVWFVQLLHLSLLLCVSVLVASVLTLLVPIACRSSLQLGYFIRCLTGLCEAATFPAVYYMFPVWVPLKEKSLMVCMIMSGMYFGEMIGISASGVLIESSWGWASVFYVFAIVGICWFPYWIVFAYERPEDHPKISEKEIELINEGKSLYSSPPTSNSSSPNTSAKWKPFRRKKAHVYSEISPSSLHAVNPLFVDPTDAAAADDDDNDVDVEMTDLQSNWTTVDELVDDNLTISFPDDGSMNRQAQLDEEILARQYINRNPPWRKFFCLPICYVYYANQWTFVSFIRFVLSLFLNLTLGIRESYTGFRDSFLSY
jgi:hypothetical protein